MKKLNYTIRPYRKGEEDYVADALLNLAMEKAKEWGFNHIYLSTAEPLTAARKKYAKLGFAITRIEEMDDWTTDGSIIKEEFWEKDL